MWKRILFIFLISLLFFESVGHTWDGYNYDTGSSIEVESYDHRGQGEGDVEYYDYGTGEYKSGYLDMHPGGSGELYDYDTGEVYQVDMS